MSKKSRKNKTTTSVLVPQEISSSAEDVALKTGIRGVYVAGKNEWQKEAIKTVQNHDISFLYGSPGTGKSFIAMALGLQQLLAGNYKRLVLTRPYVEAGEHLGYLPGSKDSKIAPFVYPLMEICTTLLGDADVVTKFIESGVITVMPIGFMRGITFSNAYILADECQNMTLKQMRLLLTRFGENSKMVLTGDTEQSDLNPRYEAIDGLTDAVRRLGGIDRIGMYHMPPEACVRSPLVSLIDGKYFEDKNKKIPY